MIIVTICIIPDSTWPRVRLVSSHLTHPSTRPPIFAPDALLLLGLHSTLARAHVRIPSIYCILGPASRIRICIRIGSRTNLQSQVPRTYLTSHQFTVDRALPMLYTHSIRQLVGTWSVLGRLSVLSVVCCRRSWDNRYAYIDRPLAYGIRHADRHCNVGRRREALVGSFWATISVLVQKLYNMIGIRYSISDSRCSMLDARYLI